MRQNYIPKSEIIGITGHNSEAGLDAYDIGNEDNSVPYLMLLILLIKIPYTTKPLKTMGHFAK